MQDKYSDKDHYIDSDSGILHNKLHIKNQEELNREEASIVYLNTIQLHSYSWKPPFTLKTLQLIHKKLFFDIYEWAGQVRNIDISKDETRFAHWPMIHSAANTIFMKLADENNLRGLEINSFSAKAAYYLGEINVLHPFREGNGRVQRAFITILGQNNGYDFAWNFLSHEDMIEASKKAYIGDYSFMEDLLLKIISQKEEL